MGDRRTQNWIAAASMLLLALGSTACGSGNKKAPAEPEQATPADAAPAPAPDAAPAPRGPGVELRIDHPDAEVLVDGESVGVASDLEAGGWFIPLEAGIHQIAVRKTGYQTWRAEVSVRDATETIEVTLEPVDESD